MKRARLLGLCWLLSCLAGAALAGEDPPSESGPRYTLAYSARISATERAAHVTVRLGEGAENVESLRFRIDPERHTEFRGDGELQVEEDTVTWTPPRSGGALRYAFRIDHLRDERSYDARVSKNWALFRGDDLVPPARVRTKKGARSKASLRLRLPEGWSAATPYPKASNGTYTVDQPGRRFDRPTGWIVVGELGVVRERVASVQVAVAGPRRQDLRRLDILALLRWTLPELRELLGELPERLLVVGAGDPMWRGGLSGPGSLYVHADRPLITGDGSSPLLHELMHTVLSHRSGSGGDALVEGLAELYAIELLARSRTIGRKRAEKTYARLEERGRGVRKLRTDHASPEQTARAVTLLRQLDALIRKETGDEAGLDDALREMVATTPEPITPESFRALVEQSTGFDAGPHLERAGFGKLGQEG